MDNRDECDHVCSDDQKDLCITTPTERSQRWAESQVGVRVERTHVAETTEHQLEQTLIRWIERNPTAE